MPWWLPILVLIGSFAIGQLLRPRPKFDTPQPSGLGDFTFPTAEEGRAIPVVFGRCYVKGTNTLWYGDLRSVPVVQNDQTLGYKYELGAHHGICWGPVDIVEVRVDDKPLPSGIQNVDGTNNSIIVGQGTIPPWYTATVPPATYDTQMALAAAARAAIKAVSAGDWHVVFGFDVVEGYNDVLTFGLWDGFSWSKDSLTIPAGRYRTGEALAARIGAMVDGATPNGTVTCTFVSGRFKFKLEPGSSVWSGLRLWGAAGDTNRDRTILPTIGMFMSNRDAVGNEFNGWSLSSNEVVGHDRYVFAFPNGLNGQLRLSDAGFTSAGLFGLPTGADVPVGILVGTQGVVMSGATYSFSTDTVRVDINQPGLYGGELEGGGLVGVLTIYKGTDTQPSNDYLAAQFGGPVPTYAGMCHAVQNRMYVGTSNFPKPFAFVVERYPNGLGVAGGKERIADDSNPACLLYDILTNTDWGAGIPAASVDTQSFLDAADTLHAEGIGMSVILDTASDATGFILDIMRHVDGTLFDHPTTGKLALSLARADYVVANLPLVDETNATSVAMTRVQYDETRNVVRVKYLSAAEGYTERMVQAMDLANIQARGGDQAVEEYPFVGLSNAATAQVIAARALKQVAFPVALFTIAMNREAWALRPASVFRLTWPEHGIADMPCRVTRATVGDVRDNTITVEAVQDVFGVAWTAYTPPAGTEWTDPGGLPPVLADQALMEATYRMLLGEGNLIATLAAAGAGAPTQGYRIHTDPAGGSAFRETSRAIRMTPAAVLNADLDRTSTAVMTCDPLPRPIDNDPDLDVPLASISDAEFDEGKQVMLIGDELIAFRDFNLNADGTYTISSLARGAEDTVPLPHSAGARVWFLSAGFGLTRTKPDYADNATVTAKLTPYNQRGIRAITEVSALSIATSQRSRRPYSPTALLINTLSYPVNVNGALTVGWSHRNRKTDWGYSDSGITAAGEPGTVYVVKIYNEVGTLQHTSADLAVGTTSYAYALATEVSESGLGRANGTMTVEVYAKISASGLTSRVAATHVFDCAGWGMLWGEYWGGDAA